MGNGYFMTDLGQLTADLARNATRPMGRKKGRKRIILGRCAVQAPEIPRRLAADREGGGGVAGRTSDGAKVH